MAESRSHGGHLVEKGVGRVARCQWRNLPPEPIVCVSNVVVFFKPTLFFFNRPTLVLVFVVLGKPLAFADLSNKD